MPTNETNNELSQEEIHKLKCLARHLLRKSLNKRRTMLKNMEKKHGSDFVEILKNIMTTEHKRIKEEKEMAKTKLSEILK